jgi:Na+-transporting NADH:ubiquinone oxidoreductase subunit NqrD
MTVLSLLILFAITGVTVYVVLFIAGVRRKKQGWNVLVGSYVRHLFGGAGVALAFAVVLVFASTAYYNSPQGPLALIVLGPAAVFLGGLVGVFRWLISASAA